ncbi:MAG TPA: ABC transporter permease subunit [Stellaceae bacterium]|nr:ABC transporter permease subunit [Stellaceae bacterium]
MKNGIVTRGLAWLGYGFLLSPLVLVSVMSFSADRYLTFPPSGWSFHWYGALAANGPILLATQVSATLAAIVTVIALLAGVPAALAISRRLVPETVSLFILSPMLLPTLVIGLGLLMTLQPLHLVATWSGLALAHLVVVLPFVVRVMTASLASLPAEVEAAATTLGASPLRVFCFITLPLAAPGALAAAALAFLISFDETVITLFLAGPRLTTLPIALFHYAETRADPLIAALAVALIAFTVLVVLLVDRLVGFSKVFK